jgi:hypothetical protein
LELLAPENTDSEILDTQFHLTSRVLYVTEPVIVAIAVFGFLDVGHVPDLFAIDGVRSELQWGFFGDLQVNVEFSTGLLDDVLKIVAVVPPEDDRGV